MILILIAIILGFMHFGVPLIYYWYLKTNWYNKPWNIDIDYNYRPEVTIIIPSYNEALFIEKKLNNIYEQNYPKKLLEVMVVDSASNDDTIEVVNNWSKKHLDFKLQIIVESVRKGKMPAISKALKYVTNPVVILSDADSLLNNNAIKNAVKYYADSSVAVLTSSLKYYGKKQYVERNYRRFYNVIRIAESKTHSTPIHSGVFQAIRKDFIDRCGLPYHQGIEDCSIASYAAFCGYRAIQLDDVWASEPLRGNYFKTKIRRAQHNIWNFILTKRYALEKGVYVESSFDKIWRIEWWLHIVNPWLLALSAVLLTINIAFNQSIVAIILLSAGLALMVLNIFRTWITQQTYLLVAMVKNIWTKKIVWNR